MLRRLARWVIDFLGDVRRANTWQVATGIVVLGVAVTMYRTSGYYAVVASPMLRIWPLFVGLVGGVIIITAVAGSRMDRLYEELTVRRELERLDRRKLAVEGEGEGRKLAEEG